MYSCILGVSVTGMALVQREARLQAIYIYIYTYTSLAGGGCCALDVIVLVPAAVPAGTAHKLRHKIL